jgi:uncharacterized protein YeaO (DUF488 family)
VAILERPLTAARADQSMNKSGVVGLARPPLFWIPVVRRRDLDALTLAQSALAMAVDERLPMRPLPVLPVYAPGVRSGRPLLVSVGYAGRELTEFGSALQAHQIRILVDVRLTPMSRKPGFSKNSLAAYLQTIGIAYRHEPLLGNPRENRAAFGDPTTIADGRRRYRDRLRAKSRISALSELVGLAEEGPVAILCVEREKDECHRSVIIDAALKMRPAMRVHAIA